MKFYRTIKMEKGNLGTIDIAPLIDVVFQLLIFFMVTSSFIFQPGIKINLPEASSAEVINKDNNIIIITEDNLIYYADNSVTIDELKQQLIKNNAKAKPLLIRADKRASVGRIVAVWDLCRLLGITQVNIATSNQVMEY